MTILKSAGRLGLVGGCLALLAACAGDPGAGSRFEAECRAAGYDQGTEQFATCVEERWARYRYVPRHGGR